MNYYPYLAGLALVLAAYGAVQTVQMHDTRAQVDALKDSLHVMQQNAASTRIATGAIIKNPEFETETTAAVSGDEMSNANDDLKQRVAALERSIHADQIVEQQQVESDRAANQLADEIIAGGYLDEQQWQSVASKVEAMDKTANKAFWEKTFAAIENDSVVVYSNE